MSEEKKEPIPLRKWIYLYKANGGEYEGELPKPINAFEEALRNLAVNSTIDGDTTELKDTIREYEADFADIKTALENLGIAVGDATTSDYDELLETLPIAKITNGNYLFYSDNRLDCLYELLAQCKDMTTCVRMFNGCDTLLELDLSGFDASKVTTMASMFKDCENLHTLNIENIDTRAVKTMANMFENCHALANVDFSHLDTDSVTNMDYMFYYCNSLPGVDLSNFKTGNCKSFVHMFSHCTFDELDVTGFDMSNADDLSNMFWNCTNLKRLDVSNWDTKKVTVFSSIFGGCKGLEEIIGFSATGDYGLTIGFPAGASNNKYSLKRLTFRTDLPEGEYAIRSSINICNCDFTNEALLEMLETLPDVSGFDYTASYKQVYITGNPCLTGKRVDGTACDLLTDDIRNAFLAKGWTLNE